MPRQRKAHHLARLRMTTMAEPQRELTGTLLGVIFLGALIVASFWILRPFIGATIPRVTKFSHSDDDATTLPQ